jgi:hypothetical protein
MPNTVAFAPNVPQQLAIKAEGVFESGRAGDQVRYELVDGRTLILAPDVAAKLNMMEVAPGETFFLCKYWNGERKQPVRWNVWLSPDSEQARAAAEEDAVAEQLRQPVVVAAERKPVRQAPALTPASGTGTYGPAAVPAPAALIRTPPSSKVTIPWNIAFRETSAWVAKELKANDLQWSDEAQQAMVCTVLIQEAKTGRIGPWERAQ